MATDICGPCGAEFESVDDYVKHTETCEEWQGRRKAEGGGAKKVSQATFTLEKDIRAARKAAADSKAEGDMDAHAAHTARADQLQAEKDGKSPAE